MVSKFNARLARNYDLIMTSYHEAGHVIYCLLHYMRVELVHVLEDQKSKRVEGFTHYDSYTIEKINDKDLFNKLLNAEICISYAGLIAEKLNFKLISGSNKFPFFLKDGSSTDTSAAAALIKKYNVAPAGKKRQLYKKRLVKEIVKELCNNWEAVVIVAHGLFQNKKLSFNDLKKLLIEKSKNKKFWKQQFKLISIIYNNTNGLDEKKFKTILSI